MFSRAEAGFLVSSDGRIVLEANPGDPGDAMTQILSKYGYGFQNITDSGLESRSEIIPVEGYYNWLCVPKN